MTATTMTVRMTMSTMSTVQVFQPPFPSLYTPPPPFSSVQIPLSSLFVTLCRHPASLATVSVALHRRPKPRGSAFVGKENTDLLVSTSQDDGFRQEEQEAPSAQDVEYVNQIKRVLELLRKNRDMLFHEVKLTIMIEDPREAERRRLLGIEDADAPTRDDLAATLVEVNEGKVPKNHIALRMLAEEMMDWPNLELESPKKRRGKSRYAKVTDTGVDPEVAAKRLNIDWDSAAEIDDTDVSDDSEVPSALGYGVLYLVTAIPIIIGVSVVLILFYNSLQ